MDRGHFLSTGRTPSSPKVDKYDLAFQGDNDTALPYLSLKMTSLPECAGNDVALSAVTDALDCSAFLSLLLLAAKLKLTIINKMSVRTAVLFQLFS